MCVWERRLYIIDARQDQKRPSNKASGSGGISPAQYGMEPWQELLAYWRGKHVDGRPPARRDIDPVIDIPKLVANLMLADVLEGGYRYRLGGSAIVARHNQELTGRMAGNSPLIRGVRT